MDNQLIQRLNLLVLVLSICFFTYDIYGEFKAGENDYHLIPELVICCLIVIVLGNELHKSYLLRTQLKSNQSELQAIKSNFAEKIKAQLSRWKLTPSETEVAWLIIKGFSFAEIAGFRGVREKTVRQQATAIYAKSETTNRNDFTSVFIEDLLSVDLMT